MSEYGNLGTQDNQFAGRASSDYGAKSPPAFPLRCLTIAIVVTLLLLTFVGAKVWTSHWKMPKLATTQLRTQRLIDEIIYLNEVLTMSARLGAATGESRWEERYLSYEPKLDATIKEVLKLIPEADSTEKVDAANTRLAQMEKEAFELIRGGQRGQAVDLLFSDEYESNKQIYAEHIRRTAQVATDHIEANLRAFQGTMTRAVLFVTLGVLILMSVWPCVLHQTRRHIAKHQRAEDSIREINKQLEHSVERTNLLARKATAASRAKSDFLANMSHEIRTPMNAILGFSEVLADECLTSDQKDHVDIIKESARSLLGTINDILDISKIEAGKLDVEVGECRLDRLLNSVESLMRPQAEEKGLEFQVSMNDALPAQMRTDSVRLRQCLINLVNNAIKFTEHGHVCINANFQDDNGKAFIRFDVEDTGVGIAREEQHTVFESFVQAAGGGAGGFGGTGLGLTITRHLAELLGGSLSLTSREGEGSVFSLVLPAGVDVSPHCSSQVPKAENEDSLGEIDLDDVQFSGRVLVAEDTPTNQILIELLLEKIGFEVTVVKDGSDAVDKGLSDQFDLIFMDIHMPNMDGYEATRALRREGIATPIVALTANAMKGDDRKCLAAGCNDYMPKPIDRKWLLCVIQKYLDPVNVGSSDTTIAS